MEKNRHTFTVLAYQSSPYLEACLLSLQEQTVKSDIIIFTSTPTLFLKQISKKFHIPLMVNKNSNGIASDWSYAYNSCNTEYVTLVHQDDIYLPEYTESCLSAAQKGGYEDSLIIFTDYKELIGRKTRGFGPKLFIKRALLSAFLFKERISSSFLRRFMLSFGTPIQCSSVTYHKRKIGDFKFSQDLCCIMDWDAWLRLSRVRGSFIYVKRKLMIHRIHRGSQSSRQIKNKVRMKEEKLIFERLWPKPFAEYLSTVYSLASKFYRPS